MGLQPKGLFRKVTDKTLDKIACGDTNIRALLEEAAGFCLFRRNELGKAFILTGTGSNGKSTYLNMLKAHAWKAEHFITGLEKAW